MVVVAWSLMIVAYASILGFVIYGVKYLQANALAISIILGIAIFTVLGSIAFFLIRKYRANCGTHSRRYNFLYVMTLLPIGIVFVLFRILKIIIELIKFNPYMPKGSVVSNNIDAVIIVDGYERNLYLVARYVIDRCDNKNSRNADSKYYGKHFDLYKDDMGKFWRSYDGESFVSEASLKKKS